MVQSRLRPPRVLLVHPRSPSGHVFRFEEMVRCLCGRRALLPPLGLMTFGGLLPPEWPVRLLDENVRPISQRDLDWADVVALSGMHPQQPRIDQILRRANAQGKLTVVGGPSVSMAPEYYAAADLLHLGQVGDATERLIARLLSPEKPRRQEVYCVRRPTSLDEQPMPALRLVEVQRYLMMPVQASAGCPHRCEFCDIPVLFGPRPQAKTSARVVRELQAIYEAGFVGAIGFMDDNFAACRGALPALLADIVRWQRARGYPYPLECEASLDLATDETLLDAMQEARFTHVFAGLESLDTETLRATGKGHNARRPPLEAIRAFQSRGMEVMLGLILGFDGDTVETGRRYAAFVEQAATPVVMINLLYALPGTPLRQRMEAEGRLIEGGGLCPSSQELLHGMSSNFRFRLPDEAVRTILRDVLDPVFEPAAVYRRLYRNVVDVWSRQRGGRPPLGRLGRMHLWAWGIASLGLLTAAAGLRRGERAHFWAFVWRVLRLGRRGRSGNPIEVLLRAVPLAHHLISWGERVRNKPVGRPAATPPAEIPAGACPPACDDARPLAGALSLEPK